MMKEKQDFLRLSGLYFVMGVIVYFAKIVNDLPNPDAIWQGIFWKDAWNWEAQLGRYLIGPLQYLRSYVVNTSAVTIVSLLLLAVICVLVVRIFEIEGFGWQMLTGALLIVSPTVGSTLTYYYCSDLYMLSYLLAVLAVYLLVQKKDKTGVCLFGVCLMLSAAIYQAYIGVAVVLCLLYLLYLLLEKECPSKKILDMLVKFAVGGGLGIAFYLLAGKAVQAATDITLTEGRGFSKMGHIDWTGLPAKIGSCYRWFFEYFFSDTMIHNTYHGRQGINIIFFLVLFVLMVFVFVYRKIETKRVLWFLGGILLFPAASMIIFILAPEVSIFDTTGVLMVPTMNFVYVFAIILYGKTVGTEQAGKKGKPEKKERIGKYPAVSCICASILVIGMLLSLEWEGQAYMKYNMAKTYHVAELMMAKAAGYNVSNKIMIIGNMEAGNYPENYPEMRESLHWVTPYYKTIWEDYSGCQNSWRMFIRQYMGAQFQTCSLEEYAAVVQTAEYQSMTCFPADGSVMAVNDIIVIKLSDGVW